MDDEQVVEFGRVITVTVATRTRATTIQLAGVGSEGADDSAERGDAVEVMQPAGLMAAPTITSTTEACFVRHGDRQVALSIIDKGAPAQDVEAGETRVYGAGANNAQTVIRLMPNGDIEIRAGIAGNSEIRLNNGTLEVARRTDPVSASPGMSTWMAQVAGFINGLAPGTVVPPAPATFGVISAGRNSVKA